MQYIGHTKAIHDQLPALRVVDKLEQPQDSLSNCSSFKVAPALWGMDEAYPPLGPQPAQPMITATNGCISYAAALAPVPRNGASAASAPDSGPTATTTAPSTKPAPSPGPTAASANDRAETSAAVPVSLSAVSPVPPSAPAGSSAESPVPAANDAHAPAAPARAEAHTPVPTASPVTTPIAQGSWRGRRDLPASTSSNGDVMYGRSPATRVSISKAKEAVQSLQVGARSKCSLYISQAPMRMLWLPTCE